MKNQNFSLKNSYDLSSKKTDISKFLNETFFSLIRDIFDKLVRRNFYYFKYKKFFKKQKYNIDIILPSKGFSSLERKKKLNSLEAINNKTLLIIGCGNGFDVLSWLKFKPKYIEAVDLLNFTKSWNRISNFIDKNRFTTEVKFSQKNILNLKTFNKFDFIVSDAVFEHLKKYDQVVKHCYKLLNKKGIMYASYGPLWYCYGGDHFSGRDNLENGYNHILLQKRKYQKYFNINVNSINKEIKFHGAGGLFVKKNLFSKKTGNEYMKTFKKNKFYSQYTVTEFCPIGYKLVNSNKKITNNILKQNSNINTEDLYLKSQIVYLRKK